MKIFEFMHANKIGYKLALFWRGWAIIAEQDKQYDLVDRILTQAKEVNAQPLKDINKSYDAFLARMRKKIANQDIDVINQLQPEHYNNNKKRLTLGQLKEDSTSHRNDHQQPRGFGREIKDGIIKQNDKSKKNIDNGFGVYCDTENRENQAPANDGRYLPMSDDFHLPPVSQGWKDLGTECNRMKENDGIPTSWNNQGFGQKIKPSQPLQVFLIFLICVLYIFSFKNILIIGNSLKYTAKRTS